MGIGDEIISLHCRGLTPEQISSQLGVSLIQVATEIARYVMRGQARDSTRPEAAPKRPDTEDLSVGEILLGTGEDDASRVYWNPMTTSNPHLMVLGQSGTGKTYSIQCILLELLKLGIPAVVVDNGQGFNLEAAEPRFRESARIREIWAGRDGLQLNPMEIRASDVNGPKNVAVRIAGTFKRIYNIGEQQHYVLVEAVMECFRRLSIYSDQTASWSAPTQPHLDDLSRVLDEWASDDEHPFRAIAEKVRSHLGTFFMYDTFRSRGASFRWQQAVSEQCVTILQLNGLDGRTQRVVTEFLLWDLYSFMESTGPKRLGLFVVLDEAHNLDFRKETPVEKIVREARKFGLGLILASQQPKDFSEAAFGNTDSKLVFQVEDEGGKLAQRLSRKIRNGLNRQSVEAIIAGLQKGNALFVSENRGTVCRILSLDER